MKRTSSGNQDASSRRITISINTMPEDRALIDQAARLQRKSPSDFMLQASLHAAEETLLDRTLVGVDSETFALFLQRLDAPPRPNAALRQLVANKAPWE